MMKQLHRILAMLLCVVLLAGALPMDAVAVQVQSVLDQIRMKESMELSGDDEQIKNEEIDASCDTIMSLVQKRLYEREENNILEGAMPCRGDANLLIVYITYEGQESEMTRVDVENIMFGSYDRYGTGVYDQNIHDYFYAVSYGKLNVTGEVIEKHLEVKPASEDEVRECGYEAVDMFFKEHDPAEFDCNKDGYLDGIIIIGEKICTSASGVVSFYDYELDCGAYASACYAIINTNLSVNVTIAHEITHLMGLPDIYSGVSLNPNGSMCDSVMDGTSGVGGTVSDLPGIMKAFFGWIDNIAEVYYDQCEYFTLESYSISPSAMVIYPNGDYNSRFIFFVEFLTPHGNNYNLRREQYVGEYGGLRIWKVYLNVDDLGNIVGNDSLKGCGASPYDYLECVNNGEKFLLKDGMEWTSKSVPSSEYYTEFYVDNGNKCPVKSLNSNIEIQNLELTEETATFNVYINDIVKNKDHVYEQGPDENSCVYKCTVCDRSVAVHDYEPVVTDPTCTDGGYTTHTCTVCGNSYTDGETDALGHDYEHAVTDPTCTEGGYTTYTCTVCGDSYTDNYTDPKGHHYGQDGVCIHCGEAIGKITDTGRTLILEGVVFVNQYVKLEGFEGVDVETAGGLLIWDHAVTEEEAVYGTQTDLNAGLIKSGEEYKQQTDGIAAKEYADSIYLRVYIQLPDGTYVYGPLKEYSVRYYCENIIAKSKNAKLVDTCIAMLHFGTAAQEYFGYNTGDLANKNIVADHPVENWNADLITALEEVDTNIVASTLVKDKGRTLSLNGAIEINAYYEFDGTPVTAELLMWEDVEGTLTTENVTFRSDMTLKNGEWVTQSDMIAAKEYGETIYLCARFVDSQGFEHYSEVVAFSPEEYARRVIGKTNSNPKLVALVQQMVIYGEYAKLYFAK